MKTKYTKKQITEAIKHWQKVLESMDDAYIGQYVMFKSGTFRNINGLCIGKDKDNPRKYQVVAKLFNNPVLIVANGYELVRIVDDPKITDQDIKIAVSRYNNNSKPATSYVVYTGKEGICYISNGQLNWKSDKGKQIPPPEKVSKSIKIIYGKNFDINDKVKLTSLNGSPKIVLGDFIIERCDTLTSLEGGPNVVNGSFSCANNASLTSLKGAPQYVGKDFDCHNCKSLTQLDIPYAEVNGTFFCFDCTSLRSLRGRPYDIGQSIECDERLKGSTKK